MKILSKESDFQTNCILIIKSGACGYERIIFGILGLLGSLSMFSAYIVEHTPLYLDHTDLAGAVWDAHLVRKGSVGVVFCLFPMLVDIGLDTFWRKAAAVDINERFSILSVTLTANAFLLYFLEKPSGPFLYIILYNVVNFICQVAMSSAIQRLCPLQVPILFLVLSCALNIAYSSLSHFVLLYPANDKLRTSVTALLAMLYITFGLWVGMWSKDMWTRSCMRLGRGIGIRFQFSAQEYTCLVYFCCLIGFIVIVPLTGACTGSQSWARWGASNLFAVAILRMVFCICISILPGRAVRLSALEAAEIVLEMKLNYTARQHSEDWVDFIERMPRSVTTATSQRHISVIETSIRRSGVAEMSQSRVVAIPGASDTIVCRDGVTQAAPLGRVPSPQRHVDECHEAGAETGAVVVAVTPPPAVAAGTDCEMHADAEGSVQSSSYSIDTRVYSLRSVLSFESQSRTHSNGSRMSGRSVSFIDFARVGDGLAYDDSMSTQSQSGSQSRTRASRIHPDTARKVNRRNSQRHPELLVARSASQGHRQLVFPGASFSKYISKKSLQRASKVLGLEAGQPVAASLAARTPAPVHGSSAVRSARAARYPLSTERGSGKAVVIENTSILALSAHRQHTMLRSESRFSRVSEVSDLSLSIDGRAQHDVVNFMEPGRSHVAPSLSSDSDESDDENVVDELLCIEKAMMAGATGEGGQSEAAYQRTATTSLGQSAQGLLSESPVSLHSHKSNRDEDTDAAHAEEMFRSATVQASLAATLSPPSPLLLPAINQRTESSEPSTGIGSASSVDRMHSSVDVSDSVDVGGGKEKVNEENPNQPPSRVFIGVNGAGMGAPSRGSLSILLNSSSSSGSDDDIEALDTINHNMPLQSGQKATAITPTSTQPSIASSDLRNQGGVTRSSTEAVLDAPIGSLSVPVLPTATGLEPLTDAYQEPVNAQIQPLPRQVPVRVVGEKSRRQVMVGAVKSAAQHSATVPVGADRLAYVQGLLVSRDTSAFKPIEFMDVFLSNDMSHAVPLVESKLINVRLLNHLTSADVHRALRGLSRDEEDQDNLPVADRSMSADEWDELQTLQCLLGVFLDKIDSRFE